MANQKKLIAKVDDVEWNVSGKGTHTIRYGDQLKTFRPKDQLAACEEFGYCVRHQAECDGLFDKYYPLQ